MRVRWSVLVLGAACAASMAQTGGLSLISSVPAAGATNVPVNTTIVLTFSTRMDPTSTIAVRGARQNVLGMQVLNNELHTITFTPVAPLDPGATYTVDYSNVRDIDLNPLAPPNTFQFSTEGAARVVVTSLPQSAQAGAGERVPLTYLLRNLGTIGATITASRTLYLLPNGTQLLSVNQPLRETLGPNASLSVAAEAGLEPAIVAAARANATDRILVVRLFQGTDANNQPLRSLTDTPIYTNFPGDRTLFAQGIVAITSVRLLNSITGGAVVREITVTAPTSGLAVPRGGRVNARALLTTSGNGIVIGRWLLDGRPFESFQTAVSAGSPAAIGTSRSLPTVEVGERRLELEILSPNPMRSREVRFTVSPQLQSGKPRLLSPAFGAVLGADPVVLRWQVVPGASGYEVGIAPTLAELGLDNAGQPADGGFDARTLALHRRVMGAAQTTLTLTRADLERLGSTGRDLFWTVRPLFPPTNEPLVDRTAFPGHLRTARGAAPIALLSPDGDAKAEGFEFAWTRPSADVAEYRVQVFARGDEGAPLLQARTRDTRFAYAPLGAATLAAGQPLAWRVLAYGADGRLLALSASAPLQLASTAPTPMFAPIHSEFGGTLGGVRFLPAEGQTLAPAGTVRVRVPGSSGATRLFVDGADVTALAHVEADEIRFDPTGLAAGVHTVQVLREADDGIALEARSWFAIAPQGDQPDPQTLANNPEGIAQGLRLLIQSEVHDDDPFHLVATLEGSGALGELDGSVSVTASRPLGGGDFEVRTLLGNASDPQGRTTFAAGDVGLQGSEFTVDGSTTRAFQAGVQAGGLKFNFTKTLDDVIGRSNFGNSPDLTLGSVETGGFVDGKGLRFTVMRSEQASNGYGTTGYGAPSGLEADVWSVLGRYDLGEAFSLRGEFARSKNSFLTLSNTRMTSSGDAQTLALDYQGPQGWMATARYRRHESGFKAPSAALLQNNLKGWDVEASGPLGPVAFLSVRYGLAETVASDVVPTGDSRTLVANLDVRVPNFAPLQLTYQQTASKGDPLSPGLPGADTNDSQWTLGTSHRFGSLDAMLSYSFARFRDFEDFNDPLNDTPNDRTTRFLSAGLGWNVGRLALRGDWSDNGVSRFDRDPLTFDLIDGHDRQDNLRLQADYAVAKSLSATAIWARSRHSDVLGLALGDVDDVALRLNWTPGGLLGTQSIVTIEFRRSRIVSGSMRRTDNTFTLLVNGAGIFRTK